MVTDVVPTGAEHTFEPDELFFSTTDAKGIIEQANSVFVRLSHFPRDVLVGAPHNIIRHPEMPGGAFKLVWDVLEAGAPVCAYVKNLAANGSAYWVFATITPLNGGYLSVRCKPCRLDLRDAAYSLYQAVRPHELAARAERGLSAARAAEEGLGELAELLAGAGFPSYIDFMLAALPAETEARAAMSKGMPVRPGATGPLADMLESVTTIGEDVNKLVGALGRYQTLADDLGAATTRANATVGALRDSVANAQAAAEKLGPRTPVLLNTTKVMAKQSVGVVAALQELEHTMSGLRGRLAELRFRISLAKLHNDMVGLFVTELIDQVPQFEDALPAIPDLCTALDEGITATAVELEDNISETREAAKRIEEARTALAEVQNLMVNWRIFVTRYGVGSELSQMLPAIDAQVRQGFNDIVMLGQLSHECLASAKPFDASRVLNQLGVVREAVATLQTQPA